MRPLGSSAHQRPAIASLRKPGAARRGLLGVWLAAAVFGGPWGGASWIAHAATLDLNGLVVTLPAAPFFTTPYLTGSNGVTNSSLSSATLIEGGGPAGTTYTGVISNGASVTSWIHTGGDLIITGANTLTGGTNITGGNVTISGTGTLGGNGNLLTVAAGVLDLGGTTQTQNGGLTLSGGALQDGTLSSTGTFGLQSGTVSTALAGTGAVSKTTAGALTLSGANTYSGGTTISGGTVNVTGAGTLGATSGSLTVSGGVLDLGGTTQTQNGLVRLFGGTIQDGTLSSFDAFLVQSGRISAVLAGTGELQQSTAGTVTLLGANTYGGETNIFGGTLQIGGAGSLGGGSYSQPIGINTVASTFEYSSSAAQTLSGGISGAGALTKDTSSSTLSLTGANTYTGGTTIAAGTLMGGAANAFSAASVTTVNAGGALDLGGLGLTQTIDTVNLAGGVVRNGELTSVNGITSTGGTVDGIGGATGLTVNSGMTTLKTTTGANTYTGPTTINGGTLLGGAANALSAASTTEVLPGGVLDLGGFAQTAEVDLRGGTVQHGALMSSTEIDSSAGTVDGLGGTTGLLAHGGFGGGVTTLDTTTGANTYTGETDVIGIASAATLRGGAANAFSLNSVMTVEGPSAGFSATLDLGGFDQTVSSLQGGGAAGATVTNSGTSDAILTNQGASSTFSGSITDGTTAKTGLTQNSSGNTLTLGGANTYSGPTTVQAGTLMSGATNAFSAASVTTVNAGGILDLGGFAQTINSVSLTGGTIRDGSLTGAIGSTGGTVNGIGGAASLTTTARTTTLQGTNTYTGATNVNGGTLIGGAANAFSAASATTVAGGATLDLGGFNQTVSSLAGAGAVTNGGTSGAVLTNVGPSSTFSGRITNGATNTTGLTENSAGNTLTLSGTNTYSGPTTVEAGSSILATGTLKLAAIVLQGNGASITATGGGKIASAADAIEFLGGTNQTAFFDSFDISTQSHDIVFADPSMATITFNNSTVDAGTGYLLDATGGSIITFNASASTLTGAMATDAVSTSNVNLSNGTVWSLTGPSNVTNLAVTNSAIAFAPPGTGGGFKTLTVNNYVGSGANIILNTALGGSSSPTDRIVVNGGSATGQTVLTIRNAGGVGGLTTGAGIPIVITTNGGTTASDAFALSSTPVLNGFRYTLVDPGGDWYLVSSPTTTQAQVQNSVNAVAKAQQDQIVTNRVLGSILLGATEQISCSSCGSGFGSIGSPRRARALGTQRPADGDGRLFLQSVVVERD
jgi:fibronectin-binding autotransporter adhesin